LRNSYANCATRARARVGTGVCTSGARHLGTVRRLLIWLLDGLTGR